jgi:hypothetical protein
MSSIFHSNLIARSKTATCLYTYCTYGGVSSIVEIRLVRPACQFVDLFLHQWPSLSMLVAPKSHPVNVLDQRSHQQRLASSKHSETD